MFFWFSTIRPPKPTAATMGPGSLMTIGLILLLFTFITFIYLEKKLKFRKLNLSVDPLVFFNALFQIADKKKWIPGKDGYNLDEKYFEFTQLNWVGMNDEITVVISDSDYFINIRGRHFHSDKLMTNLEFLLRTSTKTKSELEASR